MKKTPRRSLVVVRDTLRILDLRDLRDIAAGAGRESTRLAFSCDGSCVCQ